MKTFTQILLFTSIGLSAIGQAPASSRFHKLKAELFASGIQQRQANKTAALCIEDSLIRSSWTNNAWKKATRAVYGYDSQINRNSETNANYFSNAWSVDNRRSMVFNTNKDLVSTLHEAFIPSSNSWAKQSLDTYIYNSNGDNTNRLYQTWTGTSWRGSMRETFAYTGNNNTSYLIESWNTTLNIWLNGSLSTYTYTGSNSTSEVYQAWDSSVNNWKNLSWITYTYDIFNNIIGGVSQEWTGTGWMNAQKITITYSGSNPTMYTLQEWDPLVSAWKNLTRSTLAYNGNGDNIWQLDQNWVSNVWQNDYQWTNTYNSQHMRLVQIDQEWNVSGNNWLNDYRYTAVYDVNNNPISDLTESWSGGSSSWLNLHLENRHYNCTSVGISESTKSTSEIVIYPNPAQSTLTIETTLDYKTIKVFDTSGKEVLTSDTIESISISHLQKGIYFVHLLGGDQQRLSTQKMIKE